MSKVKAPAIEVIAKAKDVKTAIASIERRAKKLDHDIHVAAVSCLFHAGEHGDVTLMQALIEALGKSQRRNALIEWAIEFGKFSADDKGKNVVFNKAGETDLDKAIEVSPWDFKPEPPFKPFDLEAELAKLYKRAAKAADDERNSVDDAALAAVAKLVGDK